MIIKIDKNTTINLDHIIRITKCNYRLYFYTCNGSYYTAYFANDTDRDLAEDLIASNCRNNTGYCDISMYSNSCGT